MEFFKFVHITFLSKEKMIWTSNYDANKRCIIKMKFNPRGISKTKTAGMLELTILQRNTSYLMTTSGVLFDKWNLNVIKRYIQSESFLWLYVQNGTPWKQYKVKWKYMILCEFDACTLSSRFAGSLGIKTIRSFYGCSLYLIFFIAIFEQTY